MAAAVADYAPEPVDGQAPEDRRAVGARACARPRTSWRGLGESQERHRARRLRRRGGRAGPGAQAPDARREERRPRRLQRRLAGRTSASTRPRTRSCSSRPTASARWRSAPKERIAAEILDEVERLLERPRSLNPPASSSAAMRASSGGCVSNSAPEQRAEARRLVQRVLDEHVRDRARRVRGLLRVELELPQREREALAVAGDLRRRRVGQVLAPARDRELDQDAGDRRDEQRGEAERERDRARRCRSAPPAAAEERDPQQEVRDERDHADEHGDQRHQADVAVADVRELVGEDAFELALVHQVQQARGDRDVRVLAGSGRRRRRSGAGSSIT